MKRTPILRVAVLLVLTGLLSSCGTDHRSCAEASGTCVPEAPDSCTVGIAVSTDQFSCAQPDAQRLICCLPSDAGVD